MVLAQPERRAAFNKAIKPFPSHYGSRSARKIYEYLQENKFGPDGDYITIPDTEYDIYDLEEDDGEKLSLWTTTYEVTLDENNNPVAAKQIDDVLIDI